MKAAKQNKHVVKWWLEEELVWSV